MHNHPIFAWLGVAVAVVALLGGAFGIYKYGTDQQTTFQLMDAHLTTLAEKVESRASVADVTALRLSLDGLRAEIAASSFAEAERDTNWLKQDKVDNARLEALSRASVAQRDGRFTELVAGQRGILESLSDLRAK